MGIFDYEGQNIVHGYDYSGVLLMKAYNINGIEVHSEGSVPPSVDYNSYSISNFLTINYSDSHLTSHQGFAIYGREIFQLFWTYEGENNLYVVDIDDCSIEKSYIVKAEHGDSASFSDEFQNNADPYPLLYITSDLNPCLIYANRITSNSTELIRTYYFPLDKTGYYAALALDYSNRRMYLLGYTYQDYRSDRSGTNKTIVSVWDMDNTSENQDGTLTPRFIESFELTFLICMQGMDFHDGLIWVAYTNFSNNWICAINPVTKAIEHTISVSDTGEIEGCGFLSDTELIYYMFGGTYKKITFATINN